MATNNRSSGKKFERKLHDSRKHSEVYENKVAKMSSQNQTFVKNNSNVNHKNRNIFTPRDLEIMRIFTSSEWSENMDTKSTVNMTKKNYIRGNRGIENEDLHENLNVITKKVSGNLMETDNRVNYSVVENRSLSNVKNDKMADNRYLKNFKSMDAAIIRNQDEIHKNVLSDDEHLLEISKNNNNFIEHKYGCSYGANINEQSSSLKDDSVLRSKLDDSKTWNINDFMRQIDSDDLDKNCDSGTVDSLSSVIIRQIRQNKPRIFTIKKPMNNEPEMKTASELTFEKYKDSFGKYLIDCLYTVSKKYREDPFRYLGQLLITQADIRDEIRLNKSQ